MPQRRRRLMMSYNSGSQRIYQLLTSTSPACQKPSPRRQHPFNVRVLMVHLGAFSTGVWTNSPMSNEVLPDDYKGSATQQTMQLLSSGVLKPIGDKDKATKVLYEVVVGEGVGSGHDAERMLPLGADLKQRIEHVQGSPAHPTQVFVDVARSLNVDWGKDNVRRTSQYLLHAQEWYPFVRGRYCWDVKLVKKCCRYLRVLVYLLPSRSLSPSPKPAAMRHFSMLSLTSSRRRALTGQRESVGALAHDGFEAWRPRPETDQAGWQPPGRGRRSWRMCVPYDGSGPGLGPKFFTWGSWIPRERNPYGVVDGPS